MTLSEFPTGPTGSYLDGLQGSLSRAQYKSDQVMTTDPVDGRPLLPRYRLHDAKLKVTKETMASRRRGGLWRWHELLPVLRWNHVATLGEGGTPMLRASRLGSALGLAHLLIKADSLNPTGSFKARGMAVAVSKAIELGIDRFVTASAGNAAGALAAYAAASGARSIVVMPADAPKANQTEVLVQGGILVLLEGLISDCGRLARLIRDQLKAFDMSTLREPYRVEGKKTLGYEIAEDLGWQLPDVVVYPTGGGTGLVGMWKAFDELQEMGFIDQRRPRMVAVQAAGCAPMVRAFQAGEKFAARWDGAVTAAAGIRVPEALGDFLILEAIHKSGGTAITVEEDAIAQMQVFIGAKTGMFVSLETAAAGAALGPLLESGVISREDRIVLFDSGSGFKSTSPAHLEAPPPVPNDAANWDKLIVQLGQQLERISPAARTSRRP